MEIVNDYLHHERPQVRKNAVMALGVIQNEKSVEGLVRMALDDDSAEVRRAAEKELLGLSESSNGIATAVLQSEFEEPKKRKAIYALLGRLRVAGKTFTIAGQGALAWLRCARQLFRQTYAVKRLPIQVRRSIIPAMAGCGIGVALFLIFIMAFTGASTMRGAGSDLATGYVVGGIFGFFIALAASLRSTTFDLHYRPGAGAVVEIANAAIPCAAISLIIGLIVLIAAKSDLSGSETVRTIGLLLLLPLYVGAVRAGAILSSRLTSIRSLDLALESAVGSAAGILCLTMGILLIMRGRQDASGYWFVFAPSTVAVAVTFAALDSATPDRAARRRPARAIASVAMLIIVLLPASISAIVPTAGELLLGAKPVVTEIKISAQSSPIQIPLTRSPCLVDISASDDKQHRIIVIVSSNDDSGKSAQDSLKNRMAGDLAIAIVNDRGRVTNLAEGSHNQEIAPIVPRKQKLHVIIFDSAAYRTDNAELGPDNALSILVSAFRAIFTHGAAEKSPETLGEGVRLTIETT
jgi:hypothetical protein